MHFVSGVVCYEDGTLSWWLRGVCVLEVLFDGHLKDRVFDKREWMCAEVCVHAWEIRWVGVHNSNKMLTKWIFDLYKCRRLVPALIPFSQAALLSGTCSNPKKIVRLRIQPISLVPPYTSPYFCSILQLKKGIQRCFICVFVESSLLVD